MCEVDWGNGLPFDLVAKIAGGRNQLKMMRGVNLSWQLGFEMSVTSITIDKRGPSLPQGLAERFPRMSNLRFRNFATSFQLDSWTKGFDLLTRTGVAPPGWRDCPLTASTDPVEEQLQRLMDLKLRDITLQSCAALPDDSMDYFSRLPLVSLSLSGCLSLENRGLQALSGLLLRRLTIQGAPNIDDRGLAALSGMPLTSLALKDCYKILGGGLVCLQGMPLTHLNLSGCLYLRDVALSFLPGLPLADLCLDQCWGVEGLSLSNLESLPLTSFSFTRSSFSVGDELKFLKGCPLTSLGLAGSDRLDFKWMGELDLGSCPLTHLDVSGCGRLEGIEGLKGLPLTDLRLNGVQSWQDDLDLASLETMPLTKLSMRGLEKLPDVGVTCLRNFPLKHLDVTGCDMISDEFLRAAGFVSNGKGGRRLFQKS